MGCVIALLLAAILCTMLFGPVPVLIVGGVALAYAALVALSAGIGNAGAAIFRVRKASPTKPKAQLEQGRVEPLSPHEQKFYRRIAAGLFVLTLSVLWFLK